MGTDLVDISAIRSGQPEKITHAARAFIEVVRKARALEAGKSAAS